MKVEESKFLHLSEELLTWLNRVVQTDCAGCKEEGPLSGPTLSGLCRRQLQHYSRVTRLSGCVSPVFVLVAFSMQRYTKASPLNRYSSLCKRYKKDFVLT